MKDILVKNRSLQRGGGTEVKKQKRELAGDSDYIAISFACETIAIKPVIGANVIKHFCP